MGLSQATSISNFLRRVKNKIQVKDEVSEFFKNATDVDKINHINEIEVTNSNTYTDNTTGIVAKAYFDGPTLSGGEVNAFTSYLKLKDTTVTGTVASIASFHVHASTNQTVQRGVAIFGDVTDVFYYSGTSTNLFRFLDTNGPISAGSLKDSDGVDIKADYRITIVLGDRLNPTATLYIPAYDTVV